MQGGRDCWVAKYEKDRKRQEMGFEDTNYRPEFNEYACLVAKTVSLRSEDADTKVGACVLNDENRILSVGYNGFPKGWKRNSSWSRDDKLNHVIHAEQNAFSMLKRDEKPCLIGLTHSPCIACAREIVNYGIKEVWYLQEYHRETLFKEVFDHYGIKYGQIIPKTAF